MESNQEIINRLRQENKALKLKLHEIRVICSDTKIKPVDKITPIYNLTL